MKKNDNGVPIPRHLDAMCCVTCICASSVKKMYLPFSKSIPHCRHRKYLSTFDKLHNTAFLYYSTETIAKTTPKAPNTMSPKLIL